MQTAHSMGSVQATTLQRLLSEDSPGPDTTDALVLPFPYEGTVSYGGGTAKGPGAILENLSEQVEFYDTELTCCPCEKAGLFAAPFPMLSATPEEVHGEIVEYVKEQASRFEPVLSEPRFGTAQHMLQGESKGSKRTPFFVGLGGEHSVTYPFVKGLLEAGALPKDIGVLQIDAHTDLRDEWEGTKLSHACVMRRLRDDLGLSSVHVGIRAVGPEEVPYIAKQNVPIFYAPYSNRAIPEILKALPENIFLTFDLDALDPSIMPATGTPVPGGLLWYEALTLLRAVFEHKNVLAMDLVELAPAPGLHGADFLAAQLLYKCLGYKFCL